jgi:hypothetical protein
MSRNAFAEIDEIVRDRESPPKINGAHREVKEVSWPDWGVTHVNAEKRGANVGHPAINDFLRVLIHFGSSFLTPFSAKQSFSTATAHITRYPGILDYLRDGDFSSIIFFQL